MNPDGMNPHLYKRSKRLWNLSGLLLLTVLGVLPEEVWPQAQEASAVALQSDGKIVAVASGGFAVARYYPDGSLDPSFGTGGRVVTRFGTVEEEASGLYAGAGWVALQGDGKIVAAGRVDNSFAVVRYHPDGSLDPSFGTDGKVMTRLGTEENIEDELHDMALQRDGKIVVVGRSWQQYSNDIAVVRYHPDGTLDASFGSGGKVVTNFPYRLIKPYSVGPTYGQYGYDDAFALVIQADGKLVVGGTSLVRYTPDGSLDPSFGTEGRVSTGVRALALQQDGKLVAVGGEEGSFALARYNSDGSLDSSFGREGTVSTQLGRVDAASDVALQADGKLVVVGQSFTGRSIDFAMVRYHPDGTLDSSFGTGGKVTSDFCAHQIEEQYAQQVGLGTIQGGGWRVRLQPDGKIVVAGKPSGVPCPSVVLRYTADGSLDPSFGTGGTVTTRIRDDGAASALVLQADGKIVVAGNAAGSFALARYQPDGSLDPSFGTGGTVTTAISGTGDFVSALALQADGKLVVAGYVTMAPEYSIALLRYNPDGTLDTAFGENGKVTTGDSNVATALALQPDGKIVVAGGARISARETNFALIRYNSDGSLDSSFGEGGKVTTRIGAGVMRS